MSANTIISVEDSDTDFLALQHSLQVVGVTKPVHRCAIGNHRGKLPALRPQWQACGAGIADPARSQFAGLRRSRPLAKSSGTRS
jgi:hypothetical protein